jgi:hypothetical protein
VCKAEKKVHFETISNLDISVWCFCALAIAEALPDALGIATVLADFLHKLIWLKIAEPLLSLSTGMAHRTLLKLVPLLLQLLLEDLLQS